MGEGGRIDKKTVRAILVHLFIYLFTMFTCPLCARTRHTVGSKLCPDESSKKDKHSNRRLHPIDLMEEAQGRAVGAQRRPLNQARAGRE